MFTFHKHTESHSVNKYWELPGGATGCVGLTPGLGNFTGWNVAKKKEKKVSDWLTHETLRLFRGKQEINHGRGDKLESCHGLVWGRGVHTDNWRRREKQAARDEISLPPSPKICINEDTTLLSIAAKTSATAGGFLYFRATHRFVLCLWFWNWLHFSPVLYRLSCVWYDLLTPYYTLLNKVKNNPYNHFLNSHTDK